uniref:Cmk protein n=1 Tax=Fopius arisanus TaxID=64838 RepID=A0A0C9RKA3_9HYME
MSGDDREECQWQPTLPEIAGLLHQLQLSPPHCEEELMSLVEISTSSRNDQSESGESTCANGTLEKFNRPEMVEQLGNIIREKGMNRMKNNWFHEHLVEHFTRKQMIHVCSDKSEGQTAVDDYLGKLKLLDKENFRSLSCESRWNEELAVVRMEIAGENERAEEIVQSVISMQREIRICSAPYVKQIALKRIEHLISMEMGRIQKVSHFRLAYLKMRNKLILIENNLYAIISSEPSLSKDHYERLEAEQFYYKQQLNSKNHHRAILMSRRECSAHEVEDFDLKISRVRARIKSGKLRISNLRKTVKYHLRNHRAVLNKINRNNKIISNYRKETDVSNLDATQREYEEWVEKISVILKEIKRVGQALSALKTNLILHGKNIELATDDIEMLEKMVDRPPRKGIPPNEELND